MNMRFYSLKSRSRAQAAKLQKTKTQCNIPNQQAAAKLQLSGKHESEESEVRK